MFFLPSFVYIFASIGLPCGFTRAVAVTSLAPRIVTTTTTPPPTRTAAATTALRLAGAATSTTPAPLPSPPNQGEGKSDEEDGVDMVGWLLVESASKALVVEQEAAAAAALAAAVHAVTKSTALSRVIINALCSGGGTNCTWLVWLAGAAPDRHRHVRRQQRARPEDSCLMVFSSKIRVGERAEVAAAMSAGSFAASFSAAFRVARAEGGGSLFNSVMVSWNAGEDYASLPFQVEGGLGREGSKTGKDYLLLGMAVGLLVLCGPLGGSWLLASYRAHYRQTIEAEMPSSVEMHERKETASRPNRASTPSESLDLSAKSKPLRSPARLATASISQESSRADQNTETDTPAAEAHITEGGSRNGAAPPRGPGGECESRNAYSESSMERELQLEASKAGRDRGMGRMGDGVGKLEGHGGGLTRSRLQPESTRDRERKLKGVYPASDEMNEMECDDGRQVWKMRSGKVAVVASKSSPTLFPNAHDFPGSELWEEAMESEGAGARQGNTSRGEHTFTPRSRPLHMPRRGATLGVDWSGGAVGMATPEMSLTPRHRLQGGSISEGALAAIKRQESSSTQTPTFNPF